MTMYNILYTVYTSITDIMEYDFVIKMELGPTKNANAQALTQRLDASHSEM